MKATTLLVALIATLIPFLASPAWAEKPPIVQKLEQEEQTWHKYEVFVTAASIPPSNTDDYLAVLGWLRDRVTTGQATDSRYAITYSLMLWRVGRPNLMGDALTFALVGYTALQFETARCADRQSALLVARQWYEPLRSQLQAYRTQPKERQRDLYSIAQKFLTGFAPPPASNANPGAHWLCYLLPDYTAKITKDPATTIDKRNRGSVALVFVSNPTIQPAFSDEEAFNRSKDIIQADLQKLFNPE